MAKEVYKKKTETVDQEYLAIDIKHTLIAMSPDEFLKIAQLIHGKKNVQYLGKGKYKYTYEYTEA